jgi:hypothetical protein
MDIWDFINRARVKLPVEFGVIHPQLCEQDGDRFLADFLQAKRPLVIAACASNMPASSQLPPPREPEGELLRQAAADRPELVSQDH